MAEAAPARLPVRLLLCSTVIPPDISGQAVVLGRLFGDLDPADYRVVTFGPRVAPSPADAPRGGLPAVTYRLAATWDYAVGRGHRVRGFVAANRQFLVETLRRGRLAAVIRRERCGAVLVTSGGIPDLAAGLLAARLTGVILLVHMFDEWRFQVARDRRLAPMAWLMQHLVLRSARAVFVPNAVLARDLERTYGCCCITAANPMSAETAAFPAVDWPASPDELAIVYTGKVYAAQADAIARLLNALESPRLPDARLHIYSDQPDADVLRGGIRGRVTTHGSRSAADIRVVQAQADILFLPLAFGSPYPEIIRTAAPTKLAEYLSSGRPMLVHAPRGSWLAELATQQGFGEVVDQPAPELLVDAIVRIVEQPERRAAQVQAAALTATDFGLERLAAAYQAALGAILAALR